MLVEIESIEVSIEADARRLEGGADGEGAVREEGVAGLVVHLEGGGEGGLGVKTGLVS